MFLDENGVPFMGGITFLKTQNMVYHHLKKFFKKFLMPTRSKRKNSKSKKFNYQKPRFKKKFCFESRSGTYFRNISQQFRSIKGGYKGAQNFQLLIC